jgi:tRNA-Thr(GGU) m(6)t(6)A37 methyltransferase TsaA
VTIELRPIGFVEATRSLVEDDFWGGIESCISLTDDFGPEALRGLADFSHVEVIFHFHKIDPAAVVTGSRHPRNNLAWPDVGIFAQRGKKRPNRIGATMCRVLRVEGTRLYVAELDALDGTPVLDIKPVMAEFLPNREVTQPAWSHELMREYWLRKE